MTISQKIALQSYESVVHAAQALATRISTQLDEMDGHAELGAIYWGDVSDATDVTKALQEISDRMFLEGEWARAPARLPRMLRGVS